VFNNDVAVATTIPTKENSAEMLKSGCLSLVSGKLNFN
jgi:hypothetical protein